MQNKIIDLKVIQNEIKNHNYHKAEKLLLILNEQNNDNQDILFLLGFTNLKQNKFMYAEDYFKKLLSINKDNIEAVFQLALCFRAQKKLDKALSLLENVQSLEKNHILLTLVGNIYRDLGLLDMAASYLNKAIQLNSNFDGSKLALANILADQYKYEEAESLLSEMIKVNNQGAIINLSYILMEQGLYLEAKNLLNNFLTKNKTHHQAMFNLGLIHLSLNEFAQGWAYYENRFFLHNYHISKQVLNSIKKPRWTREHKKTRILIWGEQGIGDQILFSNYIDSIKSDFEKIYFAVTEKLIPFFKKLYPSIEVIGLKSLPNDNSYDYHIPLSSMGFYFHNRLTDRSQNIFNNYLNTNQIIPKKKKLRCGISWLSDSGLTKQKKSINLNLLTKIFQLNDVEFINLQYTDEAKSILKLENELNKKIFFEHDIDCFDDISGLATLIKSCDLIVTVSNSNAHIAGRLGVATCLLLPQHAGTFWYWHDDNKNSFFYPSIEYYKQEKQGDWKIPIERVKLKINKLIENS